MTQETKEFWRWFWIAIAAIIVLSIVGFGMNSAGLFGRTVVERKVFENSYQRTESIKAQIATDEAVLAEIERKLRNPELSESTKANLEAQSSAARIRIATAKGRQQ